MGQRGIYMRQRGIYIRQLGIYRGQLGIYRGQLGIYRGQLGIYGGEEAFYARQRGIYGGPQPELQLPLVGVEWGVAGAAVVEGEGVAGQGVLGFLGALVGRAKIQVQDGYGRATGVAERHPRNERVLAVTGGEAILEKGKIRGGEGHGFVGQWGGGAVALVAGELPGAGKVGIGGLRGIFLLAAGKGEQQAGQHDGQQELSGHGQRVGNVEVKINKGRHRA